MSDEEQLPAGWASVTLADVAQPSTIKVEPSQCGDLPYVGLEHIESGTGRLRGHGYAREVKSTKSVFRRGDVLYGKLRPYLRKVWRAEFDGVCSTDIVVYPSSPAIDGAFLAYLLSSEDLTEHAVQASAGINLPRVSTSALGEAVISLPPLAEQRRIAAKLDELFASGRAARAALDAVPAMLERYRQRVFATYFDNLEAREVTRVAVRDVVVDARTGLVRSAREQSLSQGVPYIRMQHYDLNGRWQLSSDVTRVSVAPEELELYRLQSGDILFNTRNSFDLVGKVALWNEELPEAVYNNNLLRLRLAGFAEPEFVFYQMQSPAFRDQLHGYKSATTSVCALYTRDLMKSTLWLPPKAVQQEVARAVRTQIRGMAVIDRQSRSGHADVHALERRLLSKAFRGELVSQGPSDEPAFTLLDRLGADRSEAPARRSRRRAVRT